MDLTSNICFCCCSAYTKASLTKVSRDQEIFLKFLLGQDYISNVMICKICQDRVDGVMQFCRQLQENTKMLKTIKDEYTENRKNLETKSSWTYSIRPITTGEQSYIKSVKNGDIIEGQNPADATNSKNLTCKSEEFIQSNQDKSKLNTNVYNEVIIPDMPEIYIKDEHSSANDRDSLEDSVSPPPSTTMISVVNSHGVPILVPAAKGMFGNKSQDFINSKYLSSSEKRKQRNREASRRYRERARGNPDLLKKMREQQNARQKKYYARLRLKKIKAEGWCHSEEESGDIAMKSMATYQKSNNM